MVATNTFDDHIEEEPKYFTYVTERNTYHTAHVLKKIIQKKPDNIKYIYLVISSVDPDIGEKILAEFDDEMKAQIVAELTSLLQFSKKELESFDKVLRRLLTEQFGGKFVLSKILEFLDIDQKVALEHTIEKRYSEIHAEFRSIMLLFEDLFKIEDKDFSRVFSEIPSDTLSIAFAAATPQHIEKLFNILPKGVKNIVQQGIELGKSKHSKTDINKAQQFIIEYSKTLVTDGFIKPIIETKMQPQAITEEE